jgi:hypothetical protein
MGIGFAAMSADRQDIFGDLAAEFLEREVIEVIAERVFDLDADLLDSEEGPPATLQALTRLRKIRGVISLG